MVLLIKEIWGATFQQERARERERERESERERERERDAASTARQYSVVRSLKRTHSG